MRFAPGRALLALAALVVAASLPFKTSFAESIAPVVGIRLSKSGQVENCARCILFDVHQKSERVAHYANPEPDAILLREHVLRTHIGDESVVVDLTVEGVALLNEMAGTNAHPTFIVTVDEKLVGTGLYVIGGPAIYITAGKNVDQLVDALRVNK